MAFIENRATLRHTCPAFLVTPSIMYIYPMSYTLYNTIY